MPHNVLISKIRCDSPNKKGAAIHNKNHFIYIGTREGTDLTPLKYEDTAKFEKEMASSKDYVKYIANRPHSHGLFGNVPLDDINEFSKKIYRLSKKKQVIYRGIVSLDQMDAQELGYYDKAKWETYLRSVIPDVAKEFGIGIDKLQWVGAYHAEIGHPHVHYMFWSSEPKVSSPFIHTSKQNKCREILSGKMFEEERHNEVINKTISQSYLLEFGKELMADEIAKISAMTPGIVHSTAIPSKITTSQLNNTTNELQKLIPMFSKKSHFKYKYVPPAVKDQINKVVDSILKNKSANEAYEKYLNSVEKMTMTYSPSKEKQEKAFWRNNAIEKLRTKLCNIVLTNVKELVKTDSEFSNFADALFNQSNSSSEINLFEENPTYDDISSNDDYDENPTNDDISSSDDRVFSNAADLKGYDNQDLNPFSDSQTEIDNDLPLEREEEEENYNTYSSTISTNFTSGDNETFYIAWDDDYKSALNKLYNTHDYQRALDLLNISASKGNVLAIHDLAKVCQRGLGCIANENLAYDYYNKAFQVFNILYRKSDKVSMTKYLAYRIGKLYNTGNGIDKSTDWAEKWFKTADDNKYAQYSLAKIYIDEDIKNGEPKHSHEIIDLLKSASQKTAYASYELGNIYKKGYFTDIDSRKSYYHYSVAIKDFNELLKSSTDDSLMYRVGKMYELGLGTEIDLPKAITLYQEAGKLKNTYALFSLSKIYLAGKDPELHEKAIQILNDLYKERPDDDMISYSLGKVYLDKDTDYYDIIKAKEYLEKAAAVGNQFAQYQLGKIFSSPDYGEPDYPLAISYLEASAAQGNDFAFYQLAILYKNSDLEFYDINKAINYFKASAELGNQFAQYQLGKIFSSPDYGEPDYPLAISYLEASAAQGNDFAMYQLAILYKNSDLEFYNISKSIDYFKASAELGNQFAQYQLGKIYSSPDFGEPDYSLAISYLEASAAQGNDFALYQLAILYKNSDLESYDISKAIDYFKASAESGNQFAQYQLGKIYSSPDFGEPDYPLAISYLEASAAQGNDFAMYQLGRIYSNKDIPIYNMDRALFYLMESANKNNSFAQLQLGIIYLWGKGVKRDIALGKDFLAQAIKNDNPFAQQILNSYETYRSQYVMNISYKLFTNIFEAILNENDRASTLDADRSFRDLSKKAMIEEQLKNPHKRDHGHESER